MSVIILHKHVMFANYMILKFIYLRVTQIIYYRVWVQDFQLKFYFVINTFSCGEKIFTLAVYYFINLK